MKHIEKQITFKELHKLFLEDKYEIEVESPTGWTTVMDIFKKENLSGYELFFNDNTKIKCAKTHLLLTPDGWKTSEELKINDKIIGGDNKQFILQNKKYVTAQNWLDIEVDNENSWYLCQNKINHNSGKSLAIYILCRYFIYKNIKTLLLVPRIDLVHQMNQDFNEYFNSKKEKAEAQGLNDELEIISQNRKDLYCEDINEHIHLIFGGQEKHTDKLIKISTRDSLSLSQERVNPEYFKDIQAFIGDEIHTIGANTSAEIVKECTNSNDMYKLGFTGSLSDSTIDNLIIEGLIGKTVEIIRMKQLMDLGLATNILIQPLYLKYNQNIDKEIKKMSWVEENKFIRNHIERNQFIARLANSFKDKNVMIIYQNKDAAQSILSEIIKLRNPDKDFNVKNYQKQNNEKCYLSWGDTKSENRNEFRGFLEESEGNILLGTTSIISTGINIKNVHIFIFANIGKKDTLTIQAVGRLVRLHKSKDFATIYDIVDDCRYYTKSGKEYPNYHYKHWIERLGTYTNEEFEVKEPKKIQLKVDDKALF